MEGFAVATEALINDVTVGLKRAGSKEDKHRLEEKSPS